MFSSPAKRRRATYTIREKLTAIDLVASGEKLDAVAKLYDVPEGTLRRWRSAEEKLRAFEGSKKRKSLGGQGRLEMVPFADDLIKHMTKLRDDEESLTTYHKLRFMKEHRRTWLDAYMSSKSNEIAAYNSLMRLCQRFAHRHGFSKRVPCHTKESTPELWRRKESSRSNSGRHTACTPKTRSSRWMRRPCITTCRRARFGR